MWCMPDPAPEFSPCDAVLRMERAGELQQPTDEEQATPAAPASATPRPSPAGTAAATSTPPPIEGSTAEEIVAASGCVACHQIGDLGESGKVGPDLSYINLIAGGRVAGMSAENYIRQSITDPNAYLAPLCPNGACLANVMPRDYGARLTDEQVSTVVAYLMTLDYEPPIEGESTPAAQATENAIVGEGEEVIGESTPEAAATSEPGSIPLIDSIPRKTFTAAALLIAAVILVLLLVVLVRRL
jgi:mono/diheme cytochrome c family protein